MAIPIYNNQDFYVPKFEIEVKSRSLGQDVIRDITQVTFKDSLTDIDSFEFVINNWDAATRSFKYSGSDLFVPGNEVQLRMGYYGKNQETLVMLTGVIKTLRPSFPAGGQPTLTVSALNALDKLRVKQESHKYEELKDSAIAKQIAGRLGVAIETDGSAESSEETFKYLIQENQYDINFLIDRARRIGYDLYVKGLDDSNTIVFKPTVKEKEVSYELTYGKSLIQFQPNLDVSNQVGKVTVQSWNQETKEKINVTVTRSEISTQGVGCPALQSALEQSFADKEEVISDRPVNSVDEARTLARETLERNAKEMLKGSGSVVGLPDLRAGSVVQIGGLDECFNGRYFVTSTTHSIGGSGYTTQFECRREEL